MAGKKKTQRWDKSLDAKVTARIKALRKLTGDDVIRTGPRPVRPAVCPVCKRSFSGWSGNQYTHYYDDDYGSSKSSTCIDHSAKPTGYLVFVHKTPIYW